MKYNEPLTERNRTEFTELWGRRNAQYLDDYFIGHEIKNGHIFEIRSNSTVDVEKKSLVARFMILTHTQSIYYGITVDFGRKKVFQRAKLHNVGRVNIQEKLTEAMHSPDSSPNSTVLRIRVEDDHFTPLLNDQPLKHFLHLHNYSDITLVEVMSDGKIEVVQLEERTVPLALVPLSGGACHDKELEEDCEMWQQYGYCGNACSSQYREFMESGCPFTCGTC